MHSAAFIPCEIYTRMFLAVLYITYGTEYLSYLRQDIFHSAIHNKKKSVCNYDDKFFQIFKVYVLLSNQNFRGFRLVNYWIPL